MSTIATLVALRLEATIFSADQILLSNGVTMTADRRIVKMMHEMHIIDGKWKKSLVYICRESAKLEYKPQWKIHETTTARDRHSRESDWTSLNCHLTSFDGANG